jgi:N-methylhydantoinase B
MTNIDAITLEVLRHTLTSAVEEMGTIVQRTAYSLSVREREDYSAALCDPQGNIVAQAQRIPMHIGGMSTAVRSLLRQVSTNAMRPGDIFMSNDPYGGSQHTPDIQLTMPIFWEGTIIGFTCLVAHHLDVGGSSSSAMDPTAKEIFQEGLILSNIRLYAQEKPVPEVFQIIASNIRHPEQTLGDLRSQAAAVRRGVERVQGVVGRYGLETVHAAFAGYQEISEAQMRAAIAGIPDGTYRFKDYIDDDGVSDEPCIINVSVTVRGSEVEVDFSGTSDQRPGAMNSSPTATASPVYYALRTIAGKEILLTEGCFKPIHIRAPDGCMLNPRPPTACGSRITIAHRIVDVIYGALAQVAPKRIETASYGTSPCYQIVGLRADSGKRFILFDSNHGSSGARLHLDGNDGCTSKISNSKNLPIEVCESELPVRFEAYEFVADSGGAGRTRGGLAIKRELRVLEDCTFQIIADRGKFRPYGLQGGEPGSASICVINPGTAGERTMTLKGTTQLRAGDVVSFTCAGAGGFGPPLQRSREQVAQDLLAEKITTEAAKRLYGYDFAFQTAPQATMVFADETGV